MHAKEPYAGVKVIRDVKYGPDERNTLDMFGRKARAWAADLHVHAWRRHGPRQQASARQSVLRQHHAVGGRNGMVGVNIEYRLAPAAPWPAGHEDIAMAVRWAADNAAAMVAMPTAST